MDARILAVDDESDILGFIKGTFKKPGYRIDQAKDTVQAIALLEMNEYDVVITDKNMPGPETQTEGGMELLKYLRRSGNNAEVIMITGYATIETAIDAMRLGAFDYIIKPFSLEVLREKVERILEFKRFLNPDNTIKSFKAFHSEMLKMFENPGRELDAETDKSIKLILDKVEHFFRVQKERERIMIEQRDALAEIASDAEELREKLSEKGESHNLLDKICTLSNRRF